jgi:SAM-dependent methyltransferase
VTLTVSTTSDFSGSIPTTYDRCLGPLLFEPYAADLVARVQQTGEGLRVLELACGTGILTRRLREALPTSATLLATDLNEAMVSYARAAVSDPNIEWRTTDAQALPFADASFDVVLCQFGFMFLPDKAQGFREARRVLRPGGVLLANVWHSMEDNPLAGAMHTRLARLFPDDPPRFFETPYGYHDADRLRADLAAGGWQSIDLEDVTLQSASPSATDAATGFVYGSPLTHELVKRRADLEATVRELVAALTPVGGDRPFTAALAATVITATR